jgi:arylsulfatase A-like enzyme
MSAVIAHEALAGWGVAFASDDSPNILLVIADDMGVDASPCYPVGDQKPHMPVLEDLCRTGVVFENVWANPQCSPTRATILTGRYGIKTGVRAAILREGDPGIRLDELSIHKLLDQRLNSRYAHAVIGKWHLSDDRNGGPNNPRMMGVGHYSGLIKNGHLSYWKWDRTEDGETHPIEGYSTSVFTDEAIEWIGMQDKPWFLWLAYTAPHPPYHLPPGALHSHDDLEGGNDIAINPLPYYLAMLEALDSELGRLLSSLSAKQRENTFIVFVGDNGTPTEAVQPPFDRYRAKSTIFEGGIHVPMIIAGAGVKRKGQRETALINTTDLFATIADLAGTGITQWGDSFSIRNLLVDGSGPHRRHLYAELHIEGGSVRNAWAIRDSRYKLIQLETGRLKLYDLIHDPFEMRNLLEAEPTPDDRAIADSLGKIAAEVRQE